MGTGGRPRNSATAADEVTGSMAKADPIDGKYRVQNQGHPIASPPRLAATGKPSAVDLQLITLRMSHHAAASGYHRLTDVLPAATLITGTPPRSLPRRGAIKLLGALTARSGSQWYHRASLAGELTAAGRWLQTRRTLFHFLYGENSYRYLGRLKHVLRRDNWLVATYHTPSWRHRELVRDTDHIRRLDAAVVVSTSQIEFLADLVGRERVFYVPHGIDTGFFRPAPVRRAPGRFRFVCVGHHLRDFDTLAAAADLLWEHDREAEIVVVAEPDQLGRLAGLPNVTNLTKLTDTQLRALYQKSDVLLLPLRDATANNALLEGMACGLPVISTELAGVRDYVSSDCCVLTGQGDAGALAAAALRARNGELNLTAMAAASRLAAERLCWPRVARAMQAVYATVTGHGCRRVHGTDLNPGPTGS
jgi:glycosyltransferase involved in cell wall biosynthesis